MIPTGVTLTTAGSPDRYHLAKMARLIRGRNFPSGNGMTGDELVKICPDLPFTVTYSTQPIYSCQGATRGGSITNLWVDGERSAMGDDGNIIQFRHGDVNIHVRSGSGISVSDNFLSN